MSDSETGDDGGIDKEALREELREKYEQDKRDREATERMSDLLLKGATMTNVHCDVCGDPLFRQGGVEFCPSCHGSPEAVEGRTASDEGRSDGSVADVTDSNRVADADASGLDEPTTADANEQVDGALPESVNRSIDGIDGGGRDGVISDAADSSVPRGPEHGRIGPAAGRDHDLERGRAALVAALEKFATAAVETNDPRRAKEHLAAAREAAKAIESLE